MPKTIDVNLLNPFIAATLECLKQMAGVKPERKRVFVKTDPLMHGDVCGIIGMTNGITGSCVVSFPDALAKRIVARFLGEDEKTINASMIEDGIGEVANMVAGGAKRKFADTDYRFNISTRLWFTASRSSCSTPPTRWRSPASSPPIRRGRRRFSSRSRSNRRINSPQKFALGP
jgi:chemotaxis protein CheX